MLLITFLAEPPTNRTRSLATFGSVAWLKQGKLFNEDSNGAVDNGIDAVGGTLTTELTTVIRNPPANSIVTNLTLAAVG